jgi:hypothetical protein
MITLMPPSATPAVMQYRIADRIGSPQVPAVTVSRRTLDITVPESWLRITTL